MAVIPYNRITNLQNDQALNPTDPYPAPDMDAEYNALKITTDDLIQHLELIQNPDGQLANGVVGREQLDPGLALGFSQPTQWAIGIQYVRSDTVFVNNGYYFCELDHISTTFAADLAAHKWSLLANFTQSTSDAQIAAAASFASANNSANSASAAATSATNAANSASAAVAVNAFPWNYDTSITMADPGTGKVRLNNATLSSVTQIALNALSSAPGTPDVSDWIVTWDDSTNTNKGTITIRKNAAPQNFAIYRVTGAVTDVGVFVQVPVAYVTSSGSFASLDQLNVEFARTGDAGTTTVVGGVPEAASDGTTYGRRNAAWTAVAAASAAGTTVTPAGNISSTNVQAALQELDNEKVAKAGDTMTGPLHLNNAAPELYLAQPTPNMNGGVIHHFNGAIASFDISMGWEDTGVKYFSVDRYNDAGTFLDSPFIINKADGRVTLIGDPVLAAHAATKHYVDNYAAPLDAFAYNGMQFNGSMEVSQEIGTNGVGINTGYLCDGWQLYSFGMGSPPVAAQGIGIVFAGFNNYIWCQNGIATPSLAANSFLGLNHAIEGRRIARLAWGLAQARPITIAFWSQHSVAGVYSVAVRNAGTRSYVTTYTHNVANTPQYNVITIPGDTAGSWPVGNTTGMTVSFMAAVGSTYIAPSANTWVTGNYLAAPSQINAAAIASSTMFFTGVLVLPGIYAPTAAQSPLIMRPFDQELRTCQRYYAKTYPYDVLSASVRGTGGGLIYLGGGAGGSFLSGYWSFPVEMRTGPTMQIYNNAGGASNASYYSSSGWADGAAVAVLNANSNGVGLYAVTGGVIHLINFDLIATARL